MLAIPRFSTDRAAGERGDAGRRAVAAHTSRARRRKPRRGAIAADFVTLCCDVAA
jgi:hypothetical protein